MRKGVSVHMSPSEPVVPRPAATVILIRPGERDALQVFMTRRPDSMRFLPGYCVFPGGALEQEDYLFPKEYLHEPEGINGSVEVAYYIAAARELFEEVGVLLYQGERKDVDAHMWRAWRREVNSQPGAFASIFKTCGWKLDLSALTYFGHRVTPKTSRYRYNTRFFLAHLPKGQQPDPDPYEIDKGFWVTPQEALQEAREQRLKMASPTMASLRALAEYRGGPYPVLQDRPQDQVYRSS